MIGHRALLTARLAVPLADTFSGTAGELIELVETGAVAWQPLRGVWTYVSGRPSSSVAASSSPLLVADANTADVDISIDCVNNQGGEAIYFRVQDADNWWRYYSYYDIRSVTTTNYVTEFEYRCNYSLSNGGGGSTGSAHSHSTTSWSSGGNPCAGSIPTHAHGTYTGHSHSLVSSSQTGNTRQVASGSSTQTFRDRYTYLQKCVAGAISTVYTSPYIDSATGPTSLRAVANGTQIQVYRNAVLMHTRVDSQFGGQRRHGIGFGATPDGAPAIDNFSLTPL